MQRSATPTTRRSRRFQQEDISRVRASSAPMPTPSAWRRRVACGVCASLLAVSLAAYADYKDSYGKGLEAYKAGRYADARQLLLAAIAEHPEPAARVRLYGTRFEPYLPQHYLGLISAAQGDCAGAQAAWAMAENAQTVAQVGDAANEEKSAAACACSPLWCAVGHAPRWRSWAIRANSKQRARMRGRRTR